MLLSKPRCNLFSQNAVETCAEDQTTVSEKLEDSGQLVVCNNIYKFNSLCGSPE